MLRNTHCYSNWGAAMRNPNENERLRAEFFRQYGKPLERVRGVRAARGGSIHQLYRDSDGKLIRLRTSVDGVLVTKAIGPNPYDADAPVVLEGPQDFIGFAKPGPRGTVECFPNSKRSSHCGYQRSPRTLARDEAWQ